MLGPKLGRRSGFRLGEREPAGRRRGSRQTSSRDLLAAKRLLLLSISPGSHKLPAPGTRSGTSRASVGISDERTDPAASPLPEPASEGTDRSRGARLPGGPVSAPALGTGCPAGSSPSTQQGQDVKTSPPRCQEAEDSFSRGGPQARHPHKHSPHPLLFAMPGKQQVFGADAAAPGLQHGPQGDAGLASVKSAPFPPSSTKIHRRSGQR